MKLYPGREGGSEHADTLGESVPNRRCKCQGLKAKVCLVYPRPLWLAWSEQGATAGGSDGAATQAGAPDGMGSLS